MIVLQRDVDSVEWNQSSHSNTCLFQGGARGMVMDIEWLGHSSFRIEMNGTTFVIDPAYQHDPNASVEADDVSDADFVLLSHGHFDHAADAVAVAEASDAPIVAVAELASLLEDEGDIETVWRNPSAPLDLGTGVKVGLIRMDHTSGRGLMDDEIDYAGLSCGFILDDGNQTLFFAGDTGMCANLKVVGEVYDPDVSLLPISGGFVIDADEAGMAAAMTNADAAIPMHYDSLDILPEADPQEFVRAVGEYAPECETIVLQQGESQAL
jgi:L-ascorbate metabolism protein UlaG (beta-lactamase superfamily)